MKNRLFIILMIFLSCSCLYNRPEAIENNNDIDILTDSRADFAFNLFSKIKASDKNLFFSPYSVSSALTMTYIGARNNTETEIKQAMKLVQDKKALNSAFKRIEKDITSLATDTGNKFIISNTLWPHTAYDFSKTYLKTINKYYAADVQPVDYSVPDQAAGMINKWVEGQTDNLITDLIAPGIIKPTTRLLLTNAIYFKGNWESKFKDSDTKQGIFFCGCCGSQRNVIAQMMNQTGQFNYTENQKQQALELPYAGEKLSMLVLLPKYRKEFTILENSLTSANIKRCLRHMKNENVRVSLPKFKINSGFNLSDALKKLGIKDAFTMNADFSGMDGTNALYLTAVLHKAFVEVNERGTEASAASAAVVGTKSAGKKIPYFNANHPFVFLIKENINNNILFMGRIIDPTIED